MRLPTRTRSGAAVALFISMLSAGLSGCMADKFPKPIEGYTCCNLRAQYGWISSDNQQRGDLVPLGAPVRLLSIKRKYYVYGTVGDNDIALRDDSAKTEADTLRWIQRVVVSEDPLQRMAAWPAEVKTAIQATKVIPGMTREQVAMAVGHPSPNDTKDLDGDTWRYWTGIDESPVDVHFNGEGIVDRIDGSVMSRRVMVFER